MPSAGAFVGNGVHALLAFGVQLMREAGVPEQAARKGLAHLAGAALSAASERGIAEALTGAVVRGDGDTLERHFEAIGEDREGLDFYRTLCRRLVAIAATRPDGEKAQSLASRLQEPDS